MVLVSVSGSIVLKSSLILVELSLVASIAFRWSGAITSEL